MIIIIEVWGHLNWTLFPLRDTLGFRSISACSFMSLTECRLSDSKEKNATVLISRS